MNLVERLFGKKNRTTAETAKDRLKIILAKERTSTSFPFMDEMRRDILNVMTKYLSVQEVSITSEQNENMDILEVEVAISRIKENNLEK
jgi:cell division topological specificity factor